MSIDRCPECNHQFSWSEKNGYLNSSKNPRPCPKCKTLLVLGRDARRALRAFHWFLWTSLILNGLTWRLSGWLSSGWFGIGMLLFGLVFLASMAMLLTVSANKRLEVVEKHISPVDLKIIKSCDERVGPTIP